MLLTTRAALTIAARAITIISHQATSCPHALTIEKTSCDSNNNCLTAEDAEENAEERRGTTRAWF
jgi:hypothetical protein